MQRRVGWVISDQLNHRFWTREAWFTSGGVGLARYLWLSHYVNQNVAGWHYEMYRPWRHYDVVIFLKSMGQRAHALLTRLQARGIPCVFDVNVNYFDSGGTEYYTDMFPSRSQMEDVRLMVRSATAVIADSEFISGQCSEFNSRTVWIPDVVETTIAPYRPWAPDGKRLRLLWSGQAVKLFELLAAEEALLAWRDRLELVLVTNDLGALDRVYPEVRARLESLLASLTVTVVPYRSMNQLFSVYADGGVFISPRFLDNRYNLGHTEWKITLAMACGRVALCSPVPSYECVAKRAGGKGIRICHDSQDWHKAFEEMHSGHLNWETESVAARDVVEQYYAPASNAPEHLAFMESVLNNTGIDSITSTK